MKKTLFGFILIIIAVGLRAQTYYPFPSDTAQWSVLKTVIPPSPTPISLSTLHLNLNGDTIINGIIYKKIFKSGIEDYFTSNQFLKCFIREENKRIYIKYTENSIDFPDTSEFILYDFNLSVGDTFTTKMRYIDWQIQESKFTILSIDSINTNTGYRKTYKLNWFFYGTTWPIYYCLDAPFEWIEGIGSQLGPFYNELLVDCYVSQVIDYDLICFHESFNYIISDTNCDINNVGVTKIDPKETSIIALPCPAKEYITFLYSLPENVKNASIKIYNIMGAMLSDNPVDTKSKKITVNTSGLGNGIYFYCLCIDGKTHYSNKMYIIK